MMAIGRILASSLCILAMCGVAVPVQAQSTTAAVSGVVTDEQKAVMPGVTVTVRSPETGSTRTVVTDAEGRYRVSQLSPGKYELQAELEGFRTEIRSGLTLTVASDSIVNVALAVGNIAQRITVTADVPLVDTNSVTISSLVDEKSLKELPINGRSFIALARLQDGVSSIRSVSSSSANSFGQHLAVSGARPGSNNFMMDGTNISTYHNLGHGGVDGAMPGMEAVKEFRILTHNYGAEYGRGTGAMIDVVTKSGTNSLRGSVYEFLRNDAFDAKNYFAITKPDFKRNQYGFSLGGRIVRDRTFFFGNYEGLRQTLGTTERPLVPTAAARQGILPTGTVPVNPAIRPLLNLYPLPNGQVFSNGTAEYVFNYEEPTVKDYFTVRLDHNLSEANRVYARYTHDYGRVETSNVFPDLFRQEDTTPLRHWTVELNSTVTSTVVNTLRFGKVKTPTVSDNIVLVDADPSLFLVPGFRMPQISVTGMSTLGPNDALLHVRDYGSLELADTITLAKGRHAMKVGATFQRIMNDPTIQTRMGGRFTFSTVADLLAGRALSVQFAPPELSAPDRRYRQNLLALFVQDDYKVRTGLTLNLGLRWEMSSILKETDGQFPKLMDGTELTVRRTEITVDEMGWYKNPTLLNFEPRLGAAYDPFGNGKTSIRAGFGVFHDHMMLSSLAHELARMYPHNVFNVQNLTYPTTSAAILARVPAPAIGNTAIYYENEPKSSYTLNSSLDLEQQIGSVMVVGIGYRGRRSQNVQGMTELNLAKPIGETPDGLPVFSTTPVRPNRDFDSIQIKSTTGWGSYHALALRMERRFSKGLMFKMRYTLSKSEDEGSVRHGGSTDGPGESLRVSSDPKYFSQDRGASSYDVPHNFGVQFAYDLPFAAHAQGALRQIAHGWSVAGSAEFSSGTAFSITQATNASTAIIAGVRRADLVPGRSNDDIIQGGAVQYFDPTAFTFAPATRWGNSPRSVLRGPGFANFDMMVGKSWGIPAISESAAVQFRVEVFNLLNRVNLGSPVAGIFNANGAMLPTAGRISNTTSSARQLQIGIRLDF